MKRYGQVCPIARALDVMGDRWSMLVVRELMIGPRRFSDLQHGLPGIGTNVLTTRLRELTDAGVVTRRELPPPTPVSVYELTDAGRAFQSVLRELRHWGAEYGSAPRRNDSVRPNWILASAGGAPSAPVRAGVICELTIGVEPFTLTGGGGGFSVQGGGSPNADVRVTIDQPAFLALAAGDRAQARKHWRVTAGESATGRMFFNAIAGVATGIVVGRR